MKKRFEILVVIVLAFNSVMYAQSGIKSNMLEPIGSPTELSTEDIKVYIYLDSLILVNADLESILLKITNHINEPIPITDYHIVLAKNEDTTYFEIQGLISSLEFVPYTGGALYLHNGNQKALGYFNFNGHNFYVSSFLPPHAPAYDVITTFFKKSSKKYEIEQTRDKDDGYLFVFENPMWLFRYYDGNLELVSSLNDKGYYTNPIEIAPRKKRKKQ